jgi:hypothetical protein
LNIIKYIEHQKKFAKRKIHVYSIGMTLMGIELVRSTEALRLADLQKK